MPLLQNVVTFVENIRNMGDLHERIQRYYWSRGKKLLRVVRECPTLGVVRPYWLGGRGAASSSSLHRFSFFFFFLINRESVRESMNAASVGMDRNLSHGFSFRVSVLCYNTYTYSWGVLLSSAWAWQVNDRHQLLPAMPRFPSMPC